MFGNLEAIFSNKMWLIDTQITTVRRIFTDSFPADKKLLKSNFTKVKEKGKFLIVLFWLLAKTIYLQNLLKVHLYH